MLAALAIRDIVLIERLEIDFARGLTVLTGETGAGKSILLDALSLALGARGDGGLVRHGAGQGQVTAAFDLPADHPAQRFLRDNGVDADGELIIRRVQAADGRSRAFVNDQPVGVAQLRELGRLLVEIHGQHDDRALVDPAAHRQLLDAFGGLAPAAVATAQAWRSWRNAAEAAAGLARDIAAARREADYLAAAAAELAALAPEAGEEEALADRRQAMMQAEKIAGDLGEAAEIVSGGASPIPTLAALVRRLERKRDAAGPLIDPVVAALDRALDALDEAGAALDAAVRETAFEPRELERVEERLFALRAAARKHNVPVEALPALRERMEAELRALDTGAERLAGLQRLAAAAEAEFERLAAALSAGRAGAARHLEAAVAGELPALKLERATFVVEIAADAGNAGEHGIDRVEFWVRTNPGARPGPLMRVASGGELSRFLLALKVALAEKGSAPTLIFDEIDTAVGGAVADAIGQRLARLAGGVQVLAVTHAPQVAARADTHLLISKDGHPEEDRVVTRLERLDDGRRREEVARMLSGSTITAEARAAAGRLIESARA
jgi:DNA repair protein RecN (Recombination protein N)